VNDAAPLRSLRRWNIGVGIAHLVQGMFILALSNGFAIPVEGKVQSGPPGTPLTIDKVFFDLRFSVAIALFLFLAAADHLLMAMPGISNWYEANLRRGVNYARWIEYSVSASLIIILIAMLPGITNLYALIGLFAINAAMILFGLLMEQVNEPDQPVNWWPFIFGCLAAIVPWIAITIALITSESEGGGVPGFVYGIFVSLFVLFNCFGLNQWLQYRRRGRFANYLYGEKVYIVLSLVAKSALAWQVYAGTLAD
jgi:heliorhodopsin